MLPALVFVLALAVRPTAQVYDLQGQSELGFQSRWTIPPPPPGTTNVRISVRHTLQAWMCLENSFTPMPQSGDVGAVTGWMLRAGGLSGAPLAFDRESFVRRITLVGFDGAIDCAGASGEQLFDEHVASAVIDLSPSLFGGELYFETYKGVHSFPFWQPSGWFPYWVHVRVEYQ